MKYKAVFGDQSLFDGASEFVDVIRFNDYSRDYLWGDLNTIQLLTFEELKAIPIVAMRRIISDPKRWTVADQKAGRLPEVGAELTAEVVMAIDSNDECIHGISIVNFLGVDQCDDSLWHVRLGNENITDAHINYCYPIETPEEKAQREEDEFVDSESFFIDVCRMSGPMKAAYTQGARAAYRKLKGGE